MSDTYFEDLPLSDDVLDALYDMRFEKCTPIQARCIEPILQGRDLIGIAQTGTGKTAAYLLPLLTILGSADQPQQSSPRCLVMAPTRELAQQIDQALQGFGYYAQVQGVAIYGGNDGARYEQERRSLQRGADIIIATPGRLLSHINLGTCDLSKTTHFVLDEADRMLDMGFSDDILKIASLLPEHRQTILFSATMPSRINQLARTLMHNPVEVRLAVSKPAEGISQNVFLCNETDKNAIVAHLFSQQPPRRVIIFCSSKVKVKELAIQLQRRKYNVEAMHSDLTQQERDRVMQRFRAGHTHILVATDIVARGIDIDDITLVLNYDVPHDAEDYVHRVGRTARAGKEGRAVTLVSPRDFPSLHRIEALLERKIPREPLPDGLTPPSEPASRGRSSASRERHASPKKGMRKGGFRKGPRRPKNKA